MLELSDVQRRVAQFVAAGLPIVVTTACLLVDKARLLPGSSFVVSAWTLSLGIKGLQHGWHRLCQCMPHCCLRVVWHDGMQRKMVSVGVCMVSVRGGPAFLVLHCSRNHQQHMLSNCISCNLFE
jgi:hypothetical protein